MNKMKRLSIRTFFRGKESGSGRQVNGTTKEAFEDRFTLGNTLGKGNFSVVRMAVDKTSGERVAVKCMSKAKLSDADQKAIEKEVDILQSLDHPHIIKLFGLFEDAKTFYVVTELVEGGELFDRIVKKEYYSEEDACKVIKTIAEALQYCNSVGVVHRDLKPENILLVTDEDDSKIKIADFGFAKEINPEGEAELKTTCGTPGYVAPEIISGKRYHKEVDMWSLGVIAYILLCGYPPFYDSNQAQLFKKIRKGQYQFEPEFWDQVSDDAKDLVKGLLLVDVASRFTVEDVLKHPWVQNGGNSDRDITPSLVLLKKYQVRRKLKKATNGTFFIEALRADAAKTRAAKAEDAKPAESPRLETVEE